METSFAGWKMCGAEPLERLVASLLLLDTHVQNPALFLTAAAFSDFDGPCRASRRGRRAWRSDVLGANRGKREV